MVYEGKLVFLVDVDNTMLDNDRITDDIKSYLNHQIGQQACDRYFVLLEDLYAELGYRDYLGALQRYRIEHPEDIRLLSMSSFLVDYPFTDRLYPQALDVLAKLGTFGTTVILSDGDVVFQPRKVERSGLWDAVQGRVLIFIHKELMLDHVMRLYPADLYILVDDKPRILDAVKTAWQSRVVTVMPRQGHYALDQVVLGSLPEPDIAIDHVGDLLAFDLSDFIPKDGVGGPTKP